MRLFACLIVAPQRGYDEPAILSYAISSFCPTSADGLHWQTCLPPLSTLPGSLNRKDRRFRSHQLVDVQAIFCRRRHQPRKPQTGSAWGLKLTPEPNSDCEGGSSP